MLNAHETSVAVAKGVTVEVALEPVNDPIQGSPRNVDEHISTFQGRFEFIFRKRDKGNGGVFGKERAAHDCPCLIS
jgi:hypothetical protein